MGTRHPLGEHIPADPDALRKLLRDKQLLDGKALWLARILRAQIDLARKHGEELTSKHQGRGLTRWIRETLEALGPLNVGIDRHWEVTRLASAVLPVAERMEREGHPFPGPKKEIEQRLLGEFAFACRGIGLRPDVIIAHAMAAGLHRLSKEEKYRWDGQLCYLAKAERERMKTRERDFHRSPLYLRLIVPVRELARLRPPARPPSDYQQTIARRRVDSLTEDEQTQLVQEFEDTLFEASLIASWTGDISIATHRK